MKAGDIFYTIQGLKNHIVHIFPENGEDVVVYKYWIRRKKRWQFQAEYKYLFEIQFKHGAKLIKSKH